jgi:predicted nucleic-acid-binding protein
MKIAVDTSVLVRYLIWDDASQAAEAAEAIEQADSVVVSTIVLCELVWVLKRAYRIVATDIADAIRRLIDIRGVDLDRPAVDAGLAMLTRGGDFADGVIQFDATRARCQRVVTFDQNFARLLGSDAVTLLGRS